MFLLLANAVAFLTARHDKRMARSRKPGDRIPEKAFMLMALLGAGLGAALAFHGYRHKTRKGRFLYPFYAAMLVGWFLAGAWWIGLGCWA